MLRFVLLCAAVMAAAFYAQPEPYRPAPVPRAGLDLHTVELRVVRCYPTHPFAGNMAQHARPVEREIANAAARGLIDAFTLRSLGGASGMAPSVIACLRKHVETTS